MDTTTQVAQPRDENSHATQAEIARLTHELSRVRDMHVRVLADFVVVRWLRIYRSLLMHLQPFQGLHRFHYFRII